MTSSQDGQQVSKSQWVNKTLYLIDSLNLIQILSSKRVVRTLSKLLPLFGGSGYYYFKSYDTLAKSLGYKNRSGVYKAIQQLVKLGVVILVDNCIILELKGRLWLK